MTIRIIPFASFVVLVIALVTAVLPGCGGGDGSASEESQREVDEVQREAVRGN